MCWRRQRCHVSCPPQVALTKAATRWLASSVRLTPVVKGNYISRLSGVKQLQLLQPAQARLLCLTVVDLRCVDRPSLLCSRQEPPRNIVTAVSAVKKRPRWVARHRRICLMLVGDCQRNDNNAESLNNHQPLPRGLHVPAALLLWTFKRHHPPQHAVRPTRDARALRGHQRRETAPPRASRGPQARA